MARFDAVCLGLFLLAQRYVRSTGQPMLGRLWEEAVHSFLVELGIPVESAPGGSCVFGFLSASGLRHQIDAAFSCSDALVLAEWKSYTGRFSKNDLIRFKAATDDYYVCFGTEGMSRPVLRIFGGIGHAGDDQRRYAAMHGIALIENDRWPLPILASPKLVWPDEPSSGPSLCERESLGWGVRPLPRVIRQHPSGASIHEMVSSTSRMESFLHLHEYWSDRLWDAVDVEPLAQERMLAQFLSRRFSADALL